MKQVNIKIDTTEGKKILNRESNGEKDREIDKDKMRDEGMR